MRLKELLDKKNMSVLRCSQESRIPYSTLADIVKGKTSIEKTAADVIYKLSKTLNISMEELMDTTTGYKKKRTNGVTVIIEVHSPRGVGTIIFADYKTQTVHIENKTTRILDTAFGKNTEPTWKQYEEFLNGLMNICKENQLNKSASIISKIIDKSEHEFYGFFSL